MSGAAKLTSRLGGNIRESMSRADAGGPAVAPPAGGVVGDTSRARGTSRTRDALVIDLSRLMPDPDQPRKEFDETGIDDLAASLAKRGQLQPIRVRWSSEADRWVIISGERRYRAAVRAGLATLLCVDTPGPMTADDLLEDQLVENCLREDLKPTEQAHAFRALMSRRGLTVRELAAELHVSAAAITKAVALLDLPEEVMELVDAGELPASTAYEISRIEDAGDQVAVAGAVVAGKYRRDEVSAIVKRHRAGSGRKGPIKKVLKSGGTKVTLENAKGLDNAEVLRALRDLAAKAAIT